MYLAISIFIIIISVLMVLIVLIQNSKGGGLASQFSSSNQIFGAPKTGDNLEKVTWGLAGILLFLCILSAAFIPKGAIMDKSELSGQIEAPAAPAPGFEIGDTQEAPVNPSTFDSVAN